ncbi:hypothetical protein I2H38_12320 [Microvirga sp. BT350]|uniref:Uncharacterized protein n=2 Tax=Microvirga alba TaxID=2791025 RepID=A0A931BS11_9HYPH|nr:hypothetical protein [Microvirga alba]
MASAAALILSGAPCLAGPCTKAIDTAQAQVDARIEARAAAGPAGVESTGALLHHQPTPESLAAAEAKLGEGKKIDAALDALSHARKADQAGNSAACEKALTDVQHALGQ